MKEIEYLNTLNEFISENQKDLPKKQTAVEWLVEQIEIQNINGYEFHPKYNQYIVDEAKEMHKKDIIDAYNNGYMDCYDDDFITEIPISIGDISQYDNAINYYNENFEKDEKD